MNYQISFSLLINLVMVLQERVLIVYQILVSMYLRLLTWVTSTHGYRFTLACDATGQSCLKGRRVMRLPVIFFTKKNGMLISLVFVSNGYTACRCL